MQTYPYKVAVITGASKGIGADLALTLAKGGVKVGLLARNAELLNALQKKIEAIGGEALPVSCDVSSRGEILSAIEKVSAKFGFIDLLVCNAGVSIYCPVERFNGESAAQIFQVNVLGAIYAIEGVMASMIKEKRGHIVGISSIASYVSMPVASVYCASKAALSSQLSGFRAELEKYHIDVTTICPGYIRTDMTAKNRFKMPFLLDVEDATKYIMRAILAKKREYAFPFPMFLLVKTVSYLPRVVREKLLGKVRSKH